MNNKVVFCGGPHDGSSIPLDVWPPPRKIERPMYNQKRARLDAAATQQFSKQEQHLLSLTRWFAREAYPWEAVVYILDHVLECPEGNVAFYKLARP